MQRQRTALRPCGTRLWRHIYRYRGYVRRARPLPEACVPQHLQRPRQPSLRERRTRPTAACSWGFQLAADPARAHPRPAAASQPPPHAPPRTAPPRRRAAAAAIAACRLRGNSRGASGSAHHPYTRGATSFVRHSQLTIGPNTPGARASPSGGG
ncbi:MAG: hypothetical protein J3K34DRAFT_206162 [Monoraphidium minutum]|nr:MAG: hypothetical protein J3K34DRAFT_206162 [Monoraphidium minutum]